MSDQFKFSSAAADLPHSASPSALARAQGRSLLANLDWVVVAALALSFAVGLGLRARGLSAIGFAEDEMNKLFAVRSYEKGDITPNSEHPMMMKGLMFLSVNAAEAWRARTGEQISEEAALRLPNVIFGALTVIPLFLLTAVLFDRWTGLAAAGFWAVGVNAITFNRVGKEDTLLVFFMLLAFYFYVIAKKTNPRDATVRNRKYLLSGISFGLMMASKYFPHYFGLNALYHHYFHVREAQPGEPSGKTPLFFYAVVAIAFLVANPAVLIPQVWSYLGAYMGERLLVHTGYLFGAELYKNNMSGTPFWGTPIYFYALYMAIKIPLLVLASFFVGLVVAMRNWRHPGNAFVLMMLFFWLVPYSLAGAKWLRYALSLMPFVYMAAAVGVVAMVRILRDRFKTFAIAPAAVTTLAVVLFFGVPGWIAYAAGPHYALYTNALGAGRAGYFFPHDEFYDDGLREAIQYVTNVAPQNAIIAHETPAVTRYYQERFFRPDLKSVAMSTPDFDPAKLSGPAFVIVQRGRIYFENREKLDFVRSHFRKVHEVKVDGLVAAEVFANN